MNATRSHLALFAKLLLLLVVYNGLACAVGHGQMLRSMFEPVERPANSLHAHHDMQNMPGMAEMPGMRAKPDDRRAPMPGMDSPFGDCFFAGSLPLLILAFALLGWLLRHRTACPRPPRACFRPSARTLLPRLNPRAP